MHQLNTDFKYLVRKVVIKIITLLSSIFNLQAGRQQAHIVGSYIRKRYDSFLPEEFSYAEVSVKCSATYRVQETSAITMAAIFPPKEKQQWQESGLGALWTPIPCELVPAEQDIVRVLTKRALKFDRSRKAMEWFVLPSTKQTRQNCNPGCTSKDNSNQQ